MNRKWDFTALKDLACEQEFVYRHHDGLRASDESAALCVGRAIHAGVGTYYMGGDKQACREAVVTTTLLSASKVANDAGVPRSTLLYWVRIERVVPAFRIDDEKQTPLFTKEQGQQMIKLARDWKKGREARIL